MLLCFINSTVLLLTRCFGCFKQIQKGDPTYGVGVNPISRLIQIQQAQKKKEPVYTLLAERGMPRRREFVMQVISKEQLALLTLDHKVLGSIKGKKITLGNKEHIPDRKWEPQFYCQRLFISSNEVCNTAYAL